MCIHLGMSRLFVSAYKVYTRVLLDFYASVFGFDYVNNRLSTVDKSLVVTLLKKYGAKVGPSCDIEVPLIINTKEKYEQLVIGSGCYIGVDRHRLGDYRSENAEDQRARSRQACSRKLQRYRGYDDNRLCDGRGSGRSG